MQIPGVHIESIHNPRRYTYAQIDRACAIAQRLGRGKLDDVDPSRLPPGHYYERGFPVLSAEPTPHVAGRSGRSRSRAPGMRRARGRGTSSRRCRRRM